jgi:hypothetical protein
MKKKRVVWPNFYIVGAPRCGTTSVWAYLKKHPQVFLPKIKEPSYFETTPPPPDLKHLCVGNLEAYQRLYLGAAGYKAIGDASTGYLWDRNAPAKIHEVSPGARIVILLRDPVERAYSQYRLLARSDMDLTFHEAIQHDNMVFAETGNCWKARMYVARGCYYAQVRRYLEIFGEKQVGIYLYEDLQKDPLGVTSAICRLLDVDPLLLDKSEFKRVHNAALVPRVKWLYDAARKALSHKVREKILPTFAKKWLRTTPLIYRRYKPARDERATKYLQSIYEPDLCRLEELLGRKLPELRSTWF